MVLCEVSSLAGDVVCRVPVSHDMTIERFKSELAAITSIPVKLQQLIYGDSQVRDDQLCFCDAGCGDHSMLLVILSIPSACTTAEEMYDVLGMLTEMGAEALAPHIDDIVSLLGKTFDTAEVVKPEFISQLLYWPHRLHTKSVHIAALRALAVAGDLCLPLCNEIAAFMPICIENGTATMNDIMRASQHVGSRKRRGHVLLLDRRGPHLMPKLLSSVLSSIGPEGLLVIMDRFSDIFRNSEKGQKEVALAVIAQGILSSSDRQVQYIDWFAAFLSESNMRLPWCALQFLNHMMVSSPDLSVAMEPYIPTALSIFQCQEPRMCSDSLFLLSAVCRFLGNFSHLIVPHMTKIVTVFLKLIDEGEARKEIGLFKQLVKGKPHKAYMLYMKRRDSLVAAVSLLFTGLGYECWDGIMQGYANRLRQATPCQKAALLLSAAQPMSNFTTSQASHCAVWLSNLLHDVNWQLRMCAIYCLQRLMAGRMGPEPHIHAIAALLKDSEPIVRVAATSALGCLGRGVSRYQKALLSLLEKDTSSVQYAVLVSLGSLVTLPRQSSRTISRYLNHKDTRCQMAAWRVLRNIGFIAAPVFQQLQAWEQWWYDAGPCTCSDDLKKYEPMTTQELMFSAAPVKNSFKDHAPLGHVLTRPKTAWVSLEKEQTSKMRRAARHSNHLSHRGDAEDYHDVRMGLFASVSDIKESRERCRMVDRWHHNNTKIQHDAKKQIRAQWRRLKEDSDAKPLLARSSRRPRRREKKGCFVGSTVDTSDDWVVPTVEPIWSSMYTELQIDFDSA